jgi:uncharacterized protein (DUF427 family)
MTLTVGTAPFSKAPAGTFNIDVDRSSSVLLWDPVPQRVRAIFAKETVVDCRRAVLLHETGHLPVYYFPQADVRPDLIEESDRSTHCPHKGDASYWHVRVRDRVAPNAIWAYRGPIDSAAFLDGYVALDWNSFDEWFVEDEQAFGHPRDPYARIDVYRTTRHVRVLVDGIVLADSRRTKVLFETSLPPRYYFPAEDVRTELLVPSPSKTRCAYKGSASYWHVQIGEKLHDDLVWTYADPQHDGTPIRDRLCFFNERVDLEVDGETAQRPLTQWSRKE